MSVLVVVWNRDHAAALVRWGLRLARADDRRIAIATVATVRDNRDPPQRLPVVLPAEQEPESPVMRVVRDTVAAMREEALPRMQRPEEADADPESLSGRLRLPTYWMLRHQAPLQPLLDLIAELDTGLVLAPHSDQRSSDHEHENLAPLLLERCPCRAMVLRATGDSGTRCQRILVPAAGGPNARQALKLAKSLADIEAAQLDALYVHPPGDPDPEDVARLHLEKVLGDAGCTRPEIGRLVRIARKPLPVIGELAPDYDLVMVGASDRVFIGRLLFGTVPAEVLSGSGSGATAMTVLRRAEPPHARWLRLLEQTLLARLPQLNRQARLDLTERLGSGSTADVDFIALILLSTAIAGLGLIADSTAVVVGAMLVAPLMTPIVAAGLGLVQGNLHMVRIALRSILVGFVLALGIGYLLGLLAGPDPWTSELAARGQPTLLDLFVALFSGIAAAYALARPNLSAALPGVAIAAALVPPIATTGISLATGHWHNAEGAALLFVTNVLTIILGAALALYAVGLRPAGGRGWVPRWVGRFGLGLVVAVGLVVVPLIWKPLAGPDRHADEVRRAVEARLAEHPEWTLAELAVDPRAAEETWVCTIEAAERIPATALPELQDAIASIRGRSVRLRIRTLLTVSLP